MDAVSTGLLILTLLVGAGAIISGICDHRIIKHRESKYVSTDLMCNMAPLVINCSLEFLCNTAMVIPYNRYHDAKEMYKIYHPEGSLSKIVTEWKVMDWEYIETVHGERYILFKTNCDAFRGFLCTDADLVHVVSCIIHSKEQTFIPDVDDEAPEIMDCVE